MKAYEIIRKSVGGGCRHTTWAMFSAGALLAGGMATTYSAYADDMVVHPSSCVAPFLSQAGPMRWHEFFVMNPDTNIATYLICPINFDPDTSTLGSGGSFTVQVFGGRMDSAGSGLPTCEVKVHRNTNLRLGIYLNRPPDYTYKEGMPVSNSGSLWRASLSVNRTDIENKLDTTSQYEWALAAVCLLPPGYGVSQVRMRD